ncbi:MAG TPA: aminotransferase class V-fold PLP-dependent enzyme [Candidatus Lustribacter sp.]|nr:aminotransferase class V-fold PLP-dependent enzyme [Candidatus Lustribacter sp.]
MSVAPCSTSLVPRTVGSGAIVPTRGGLATYANLDHGASTPALTAVRDAVDATVATYSSVHRGNGYHSRVTSAWYEQARAEVAAFVGARPDDTVIFTRNTTDSVNLLARTLPAGTTVVVFASEHHSTLLAWPQATVRLPVPRSVGAALASLEAVLASDTSAHRLVVVAGASNVTGEIWPITEIVGLAHRYGARVALDAAQYAPHRRVDLAATGLDYVAFSGHKIYAPYGAGVLAGRRDWLDAGAPYLRGGGATARVTSDEVTWATGASRHEGGSPNVVGAVALAAACATLTRHWDAVETHEAELGARLRQGLALIPGVRTYSLFGAGHERAAVSAFTVDGVDSSLVSAVLSADHGIGVRDGKFCAHLLVDVLLGSDLGLAHRAAGHRTAVRASVGLATTAEHVERLLVAVAELADGRAPGGYVADAGGYVVADDPRELVPAAPW